MDEDRPPAWGKAVHEFCAAVGIPVPPPPTAEQRAAFEAWMREGDAQVEAMRARRRDAA
ncbi:hypothetical protein FB565_006587 [Actinoplanes lutulentus]|nr:hypothetical protein [Actinoplanes lutulentus]MBB2946819.1 hypothetical protein [Actinoplanes lutulentus]